VTRRILDDADIEAVRFDLGEGDWVDLKSRFRVRDRGAINKAIIEGEVTTTSVAGVDGKRVQVVKLGELALDATSIATMVQGVIRWGGPGFCVVNHDRPGAPTHAEVEDQTGPCRIRPMTVEALGNMDDVTGMRIVAKINDLNPEPKEGSDNP
jgi:hypothetical protein